ncbi:MAG TPA: 1-(5-phosphoribosyl)-5-amino-4-imidazole-carboxylate carboxylase, partial [Nitrospirota bacterium]
MNIDNLKNILSDVQSGGLDLDAAMKALRHLPFEDIEFAVVDHHRHLRQGAPEVIYSEGKTPEQVKAIAGRIIAAGSDVLATRAGREIFEALKEMDGRAVYHEAARCVVIRHAEKKPTDGVVLVITAGTTDIPVAEEAAVTAEALGSKVMRMYDVGVSGLHRLLSRKHDIFDARVIVVAA